MPINVGVEIVVHYVRHSSSPQMKTVASKKNLLILLVLLLAYNSLDRLAWNLALQDIKVDIDLSDSQLGLLGGIAFEFFYALLGLPIARVADHGFAVEIIVLTTALSGASMALCGAVHAFTPLALARMGIAFDDASTLPLARSLNASHFSRAERPRATAIFFLGRSASAAVGYSVVGWLNKLHGWRATFGIIGLPALAFACGCRSSVGRDVLAHSTATTWCARGCPDAVHVGLHGFSSPADT